MKTAYLASLVLLSFGQPSLLHAQESSLGGSTKNRATQLAELMCRQLPNAAAFPLKGSLIGDDVHDTLVMLGNASLPCLIDRITDNTWMPDPRMEPLTGDFRAGDGAFFILCDMGVDFGVVLPMLDKKRWEGVGVFAYFDWVNRGNHRKLLQDAVLHCVREHPHCCDSKANLGSATQTGPEFRMGAQRLSQLHQQLFQIKPGMDESSVREMLGTPDFADNDMTEGIAHIIDINREERAAAVYFVERWSEAPRNPNFRGRDFLWDRYVIVFFAKQGKFVRLFSNVEEIPPIFPQNRKLWMRLMIGNEAAAGESGRSQNVAGQTASRVYRASIKALGRLIANSETEPLLPSAFLTPVSNGGYPEL